MPIGDIATFAVTESFDVEERHGHDGLISFDESVLEDDFGKDFRCGERVSREHYRIGNANVISEDGEID